MGDWGISPPFWLTSLCHYNLINVFFHIHSYDQLNKVVTFWYNSPKYSLVSSSVLLKCRGITQEGDWTVISLSLMEAVVKFLSIYIYPCCQFDICAAFHAPCLFHIFCSVLSEGLFGQHIMKKPKLMKQLLVNSFDNLTPMAGSITSPVASQMSNMSSPNKLIKILAGRDRERKAKSFKVHMETTQLTMCFILLLPCKKNGPS